VRTQGIPERLADREGSRASGSVPPRRVPRPKPVSAGSSDAVPAVPRILAEPKVAVSQRPIEEGMETAVASIHDTGPVLAEAGAFERDATRWSLPVPRRFLVLFGVGLVTLGALLAWVVFVPPEVPPAPTATASTTPSPAPTAASPTPSPSEDPARSRAAEVVTTPSDAPAPATPSEGAVEVKAIAGARVEVDGVDVGPAPLTKPLSVGTHHVRITAPGYVPWEETIDIVEGDNPALAPRLVKRKRGSKAGLPSLQELGGASPTDGESPPPATEPAADDDWTDSPPPVPVETKPPEPFKPPPAPDPPKRDANPFLPSKPSEPADPGLLPTN
jgi:hypothetical protein